jgi:molybdopterin/thiamine biosynthesis adenylyltransferase
VTDWNRVERLFGQAALDHLRQQAVAVVGLGSGGGYVALTLAMSGIGRFVLVDDDVLEPANIVRHVADRRYLGQPKVEAVADLILQRNPDAQIQVVEGRIEDHLDLLDDVDIVAVGADGEAAKFMLNEVCLERNLIAVYAGVYERGEGGDAVIIRPFQGPCYACWADTLREGYVPPDPDGEGDLDYGQRRPDGAIDAEPGLWLDVVRVANTQATMILNVLLEGTGKERALPANTVLIASRELEIIEGQLTPPFGVEWVDISRNVDCLICGDLKRQTATLSLEQLMHRTASDTTDQDTETASETDHE